MKTRLELAHDYLRDIISNWDFDDSFDPVAQAYEYADAMLSENENGEQEARKKKRAEMRELLNANNTFLEKEGQHFDDVEWQPDWGQAPDGRIQYFAVDENGRGGWYINKPVLCYDHWYWSDFEERMGNDCYDYAPSFNYQGNWRDSLRKRPV